MKRLLTDTRLWFLLVFSGAVLVLSRHGVSQQPIHGDNAFLLYMQRVAFEGQPLYQTTVFDYPPLGPIIGAIAMKIGNAFDLPFYLGPRYFCVVIASLTASFIMLIVQKSTGNLWAGVFGGIVVASLQLLGVLVCTNLDPKVLLAFFMTLAAVGIAYNRWWLAGMGSVLATCCWQPAIIVPLAALIVFIYNRDSLRFRSFILGIVLGSLPLILYFLIYGGVKEFFYQGILNQAMRSAGGSTGHFHFFGWAGSLWRLLSSERIFVGMAGAGFFWFAIQSIRKGIRQHWMNPLMGGIPVFTFLWICFSSLHFQGWNDAAPFFPIIGFWAGWTLYQLIISVSHQGLLLAMFLPVSAVFGSIDAFTFQQKYDLPQEITMIRETVQKIPRGKTMLALGAEEFYLFTNYRPFWKYLRLDRQQENFIRWFEPEGCNGLIKKFQQNSPELIVQRVINPNECWARIETELLTGYQRSKIDVPGPRRPFSLKIFTKARE